MKAAELIEEAQSEVTALMVGDLSYELVDIHDEGRYGEALALLQAGVARIQRGIKDTSETATLVGDFDLEAAMAAKLEMGVPFGIKLIDDEFFGFQPSMLVTLLGRQKSTKSTLMLNSALKAWEAGYDVLFYSVELDMNFLRQRLYALGAHVSSDRFRRGTLRPSEQRKLREFHAKISGDSVKFRVSHKKAMVTMDDLIAEVDRYQPHVVYVDGFYFMQDRITRKSAGSDWQANENLAAELKSFAMDKGLVILTSTQAQEKQQGSKKTPGIEGRTIMGGTGLLKASDLVLGSNKFEGGILVNEIFNRFTPVPDVTINWDWEDMTMTENEYVDHDAERDRQRDEFVAEMP
jgi:replicative DNA helicase